MIFPWLPVIWLDVIGSTLILILAVLCVSQALKLLNRQKDQIFFNYLFLLTISFVFFAISRSIGHLVKQGLFFFNKRPLWHIISPFSGALNTASFIVIFSFGIYFYWSRRIYTELEKNKSRLTSLVSERTSELEKTIGEFSAVMEAIDYGILFMDDRLKVRIANRAFRKIWGLPEHFLKEQPTFKQILDYNRYKNILDVPDDQFDAYSNKREADIRAGTIHPQDFVLKNGTILQYQCIVLPDGWRMLTYFDITELKNTQKQLTYSQKMEAIGLMAGGVAHDLNNILSGVVSYPDLLLMQLPENSELRKPLQVIQKSGQQAAAVVADLLTVARGVASHRETHSLNEMILEYLHSPEGIQLKKLFPQVDIQADLTPQDTYISCSPVHVKKSLMNLVTNATEAISGKGTVWIETRVRNIDTPLAGNDSMQPGQYAVAWVRDNGQGISTQDIKHIFEPFYTKKVMGLSGTGLGLSIVWNTVQEHNGGITVSSTQQGTCFALYFPISDSRPDSKDKKQNITSIMARGQSVLVVDDEKQQREIARQMLSTLNYKVETSRSGEEAVAWVQHHHVDIVLLDMLMEPGMNGRQTYEQILTHRPGQRAIIVSGYSENEEVEKARELGKIDFIRKPYTLEQIGNALLKALS